MEIFELDVYRSPASGMPLKLAPHADGPDDVRFGKLVDAQSGIEFEIRDAIPNLIFPQVLSPLEEQTQAFYDGRVDAYDEHLHLTFDVHGEDEQVVRNGFIDLLNLQPESRALEVAAGTGRDSEIIAGRISREGILCVVDIAPSMLARCRERLSNVEVPVSFSLASASYLPFPNDYFDAVYSFGGLGEFPNIKKSLSEMVRVAKPGAKVVVGDESMPPWLRHTEFSKILTTTNPQFRAELPLADLPVDARNVSVRWVIGGVFYLIDFGVGVGEPTGNFDFKIPGVRGGTLRTRYEGQMEGVTPEAKKLATLARERRGISMHDWMDEAIRTAAKRDLGQDSQEH